jgi:hypothetical protein
VVDSAVCSPSLTSFFSEGVLQEVAQAAKKITRQMEKLVRNDFMSNRLTFEYPIRAVGLIFTLRECILWSINLSYLSTREA